MSETTTQGTAAGGQTEVSPLPVTAREELYLAIAEAPDPDGNAGYALPAEEAMILAVYNAVEPVVSVLVAQARTDATLEATQATWAQAHAERDRMVDDFTARIEKVQRECAEELRKVLDGSGWVADAGTRWVPDVAVRGLADDWADSSGA